VKFAFVTTMSGAPWGGSEELWSQATLRLREEHHDVAASVVPWPRLSPKVTALEEQGIEVRVRWPPAAGLPARVWRKVAPRPPADYEWMRKINPDLVVISQGANADGLEWMTFCPDAGIPFVAILSCNAEGFWPSDELPRKWLRRTRQHAGCFVYPEKTGSYLSVRQARLCRMRCLSGLHSMCRQIIRPRGRRC
jgi:hypothetical protein